jgi:hypothetical protein
MGALGVASASGESSGHRDDILVLWGGCLSSQSPLFVFPLYIIAMHMSFSFIHLFVYIFPSSLSNSKFFGQEHKRSIAMEFLAFFFSFLFFSFLFITILACVARNIKHHIQHIYFFSRETCSSHGVDRPGSYSFLSRYLHPNSPDIQDTLITQPPSPPPPPFTSYPSKNSPP